MPSQPRTRRFLLNRDRDPSGVSGTGIVAEGIRFSDNTAVLRWVVGPCSFGVYSAMEELVAIHGHGGLTQVVWLDD